MYMSKRFLITVNTAWCGEDNTYSAIANSEIELHDIAAQLAYDNFQSFDGLQGILEQNYEPNEDGEYSDEDIDCASLEEGEYYGYIIEEFEGDDEEFGWYDLVYDCTEEKWQK